RIEALLRRSEAAAGSAELPQAVVSSFGDVEIDEARSEVRKAGQALQLTVQEYRLLVFMAAHPGRTLSRRRLLDEVWGYDADVNSRTVDVHVSSLRQKLGEDPNRPRWVLTVRGFGYRFEPGA
ncbi:MAG TPA: response regulator transcription factor, partial [Spirochaetales bacterium]|nr:response regulator transcription factor [Spirochaetales bacterium]